MCTDVFKKSIYWTVPLPDTSQFKVPSVFYCFSKHEDEILFYKFCTNSVKHHKPQTMTNEFQMGSRWTLWETKASTDTLICARSSEIFGQEIKTKVDFTTRSLLDFGVKTLISNDFCAKSQTSHKLTTVKNYATVWCIFCNFFWCKILNGNVFCIVVEYDIN